MRQQAHAHGRDTTESQLRRSHAQISAVLGCATRQMHNHKPLHNMTASRAAQLARTSVDRAAPESRKFGDNHALLGSLDTGLTDCTATAMFAAVQSAQGGSTFLSGAPSPPAVATPLLLGAVPTVVNALQLLSGGSSQNQASIASALSLPSLPGSSAASQPADSGLACMRVDHGLMPTHGHYRACNQCAGTLICLVSSNPASFCLVLSSARAGLR
jgi:hypothetical protein